jgi:hypothetical protein
MDFQKYRKWVQSLDSNELRCEIMRLYHESERLKKESEAIRNCHVELVPSIDITVVDK